MKNIKMLKAEKLQGRIYNECMLQSYNMITRLNEAIKNDAIDDYMKIYKFRNYKTMEIAAELARVKVMRCAKILNRINNKYNTGFCNNDVYAEICQLLDETL